MVFKVTVPQTLMGVKSAMMVIKTAVMGVLRTARQLRQDGSALFGESLAIFFAEMESWTHPTSD
jgi:hypothetical protein